MVALAAIDVYETFALR